MPEIWRDYDRFARRAGAERPTFSLHADPYLLLALTALVGFGLLVLNSAARDDPAVLGGQVLRLAVGFVAMLVAAQFRPRAYQAWMPVLYLVAVGLLAIVLIGGAAAKGSQRWLDLPGLPRFQPSELVKLAVPLAVAWYLRDRPLPPSLRDVAVVLLLVGAPAALIVMQPDLGTALLVCAGGFGVLLLAGLRWPYFAGAVGAGLVAVPLLWLFVMRPYQKMRVLTLFDPERDPQGAGWNIIQSKAAIGSGGFRGKGLFEGTQSQLGFLPESRTDFIIAVIGEELGLIGVTLAMALYVLVIARALYLATQAQDTFARLASGGLTLVFFTYVFVNIGMASGLLPVVGVPLPLISYGGSAAVTLLIAFGIVMSAHDRRPS